MRRGTGDLIGVLVGRREDTLGMVLYSEAGDWGGLDVRGF